jgi:hypothetical protein
MRLTVRASAMAAAFWAAAIAAVAAARYQPAMIALDKAKHGVVWDTKGAIMADVTCDGKPDLVIVGQKGGMGVVAIVPGLDRPGPPIIGEFPTGRADLQDGFCEARPKVYLEPRDCRWEDGVIPGCKVVRGCKAFRVGGADCDAFHFYWDTTSKRLKYDRL